MRGSGSKVGLVLHMFKEMLQGLWEYFISFWNSVICIHVYGQE